MPTVRVLVLTDNRLLGESLRGILGSDQTLAVVGEADGAALAWSIQHTSPDVLLVDGGMKDPLTLLQRNGSRPWGIVLGAEADEEWAENALLSGARGILLKSARQDELVKAIAVVHEGGLWANRRVTARIVQRAARSAPERQPSQLFDALSPREREVVGYAARGLTYKEIAGQLAIGQATVKTHLRVAFRKVGARNRAQLTALYHHLLSDQ